jgi:hypothetical protein
VFISPRAWFIDEIIMNDCNNWTSRQFNPRHKLYPGNRINRPKHPAANDSKKSEQVPVNIWKQEKVKVPSQDEPSHVPSEGGESLDSIRSQLTEEVDKNKKLLEANQQLIEENDSLNVKVEKLSSDNVNQNVQLKEAMNRISRQEAEMRDFKSNQELIQISNDKKMAMMLEKFNCITDNDEQMKKESKRVDTDTPDDVSSPETKQMSRSKTQKTAVVLPKPASLFVQHKSSSPSRTLAAISETGQGIRHRTPQRQASTPSATETNGGSKK